MRFIGVILLLARPSLLWNMPGNGSYRRKFRLHRHCRGVIDVFLRGFDSTMNWALSSSSDVLHSETKGSLEYTWKYDHVRLYCLRPSMI